MKCSYVCLIIAFGLQCFVKLDKTFYYEDSNEVKKLRKDLNQMETTLSDAKSNSRKNFLETLSESSIINI